MQQTACTERQQEGERPGAQIRPNADFKQFRFACAARSFPCLTRVAHAQPQYSTRTMHGEVGESVGGEPLHLEIARLRKGQQQLQAAQLHDLHLPIRCGHAEIQLRRERRGEDRAPVGAQGT